MMTTSELDAFFEQGWNRHDVDRLMSFMAEECVFESASRPEACGGRHVGREAVRSAFARIFEAFPAVRFYGTPHRAAGRRRGSEVRVPRAAVPSRSTRDSRRSSAWIPTSASTAT